MALTNGISTRDIITLDAMGTQKQIAQQIIQAKVNVTDLGLVGDAHPTRCQGFGHGYLDALILQEYSVCWLNKS